ncbi:hypothetical protein AB6813_19720 [bacterium RCC_150]
MITETMTLTVTTDTAESVTVPVLPADDRTGDGYDRMDTLEDTEWSMLPSWQRGLGRRILALRRLRRRPHPRREGGAVRLRDLRRRRPLHLLVPVPGRLLPITTEVFPDRPGHAKGTPTSVDNIIEIPADCRRPLHPVNPPSLGPAGAGILRRRSFLACFLSKISRPLAFDDRVPLAAEQGCRQPKKQL